MRYHVDRLGLTSSLEYFPTLGIDAVWITPIFASPMADFGYDISDYRWVCSTTNQGQLDNGRAAQSWIYSLLQSNQSDIWVNGRL